MLNKNNEREKETIAVTEKVVEAKDWNRIVPSMEMEGKTHRWHNKTWV